MPTSLRRILVPAAWVAGVSGVLLLLFPVGFPNYDTIYALLWGREMAHGFSPDMSAPLAPTPHPLYELLGILTSPLGDSAITVSVALAYVSLGLVAYLVYRLGTLWFERSIGIVAAVIVLTRAPFLSNGLRAYVDLPYIAICLAALLAETRKPRAGWPVLALLIPAGLLRPEAWLFAFAYLGYLAIETRRDGPWRSPRSYSLRWRRERSNRELLGLAALAVAGPALWVIFDLITTGDPAYSFTGTRQTVETLDRQTGPVDLVLYGPRRLGEVLQWPGMIAAAGGIVFCIGLLWKRSRTGLAAALLALIGFAILAISGLAIIPRYTMLAGAVLSIFVGAGLLGWRLLETNNRWRSRWQWFAALGALLFILWIPQQVDLLDQVNTDLTNQSQVEGDLSALVDDGGFEPSCPPISVPNHRAVPRLAFWLDIRPSEIISSTEQSQSGRGYFLNPASDFVVHNFVLDPNDPSRLDTTVPPGFRLAARNRSWKLYRRCR